jgi:AcrR family transcriptional regulator
MAHAVPVSAEYEGKLERLLDLSARMIAEKGYHNTSIRDIARATGMSLAGLYYYVRSKEELLFLIQSRLLRTVLDDLARRLEGVDDPRERLRIFVDNHVRFFSRHMPAMKVMVHEYDGLTGEYREKVRALRHEYTEILLGILRDVRRVSGAGDAVVLRVAAFALFGMINWIYTWYRAERDVPVDRLADQMVRLFLGGFLGHADVAWAAGRGGRGVRPGAPQPR